MAGVFFPAVVEDEETDEEDGINKAKHEKDVFLIILYPREISDSYAIILPRNNNGTLFVDLRREIEDDLDYPPFRFLVNVDNVSFTVKLAQEKKWNFNKFGNVEGNGEISNPFRIYLKEETEV